MSDLWKAVTDDLSTLHSGPELWRVMFRLVVATLLGGIVGMQREHAHRPAGLRTHILVTVGSALFALTITQAGGTSADLSHVIQGIVTGIGFIGAGAIIKLDKEHEVRGLTTAAGIWMSTALGVSAGLGRLELAIPGTALAWIVLSVLRRFEPDHNGNTDRHPAEGR
jgi:putative Mg2+ transporter-C (MgtC) family protein